MNYRSSLAGQHISGNIVAGVGSSHGIEIGGGSTGGTIQAVGDDANISLSIFGKGSGGIVIGNSSQTVLIGASSGLAFKGYFTSTQSWALAATSSGQVGELTFTSSQFDVNPGDLIGAIEVTPTTSALIYGGYRLSTVATSRLTVIMANVTSTATSTTSGGIRVTWADLT